MSSEQTDFAHSSLLIAHGPTMTYGLVTQANGGRGSNSRLRTRDSGLKKSALDFSVQDASAALPQNCQTTIWMVESPPFSVNVTLVMEF